MNNDDTAIPLPGIFVEFGAAQRAYKAYEDAVQLLALEENAATGYRIALETSKMFLLANTDPALVGKNEEQRKAWLHEKLASENQKYNASLRSVDLLKSEVEIARIRCRWHDNVLRYLELTAWKEDENA